MEIKNRVEAILFAAGKKVELEELSKMVEIKDQSILADALKLLQKEYEDRNSPLILFEEGSAWKITVKEEFLPYIQNIVSETELDKSTLETLAVIAWKYPILQADVIHIRTNKAYDHIKFLEETGFIAREKFGRTKKIKLTEKFFNYFSLPKDKEQQAFKDTLPPELQAKLSERENEILHKEKVIDEYKQKKREELKEKKEASSADIEVDMVDDEGHKQRLEQYEEEEKEPEVEVYEEPEEPVGEVEVVDEEEPDEEKEAEEDKEEKDELPEEEKEEETEEDEKEEVEQEEKPDEETEAEQKEEMAEEETKEESEGEKEGKPEEDVETEVKEEEKEEAEREEKEETEEEKELEEKESEKEESDVDRALDTIMHAKEEKTKINPELEEIEEEYEKEQQEEKEKQLEKLHAE